MMKLISILFLIIVFPILSFSNPVNDKVDERKEAKQGNELFKKKEYKKALSNYEKAFKSDSSKFRNAYNKGCANYKLDSSKTSLKDFESAIEKTKDKSQKAKAYHNLGNALMKNEKYKEGIEAYKNALKNNPKDNDTKYNLSYALRKLKKEQEKQNQDKNKKQKPKSGEDDKKNKDSKQGDKKDEKNQDKDSKENKAKNAEDEKRKNNSNEEGKENEKKKQNPQNISDEEADRILNALKNEEKKVQKKMMMKNKPTKKQEIEKKW